MLTQFDSIDNLGGIVNAWFITTDKVKRFFKLPDKHEAMLELIDNAEWTPIYMAQNAEVNETQELGDNGEIFSPYLKLKYPLISSELSYQQRLLFGRSLIVKVTTSNDFTLYIGTPDFPATYSYNKSVGSNAASFSGYEGLFSAKQTHSMLFESSFTLNQLDDIDPGEIKFGEFTAHQGYNRFYVLNKTLASGGSGSFVYQWEFYDYDNEIWDTAYEDDPLTTSLKSATISGYHIKSRRKCTDIFTGYVKYSKEIVAIDEEDQQIVS